MVDIIPKGPGRAVAVVSTLDTKGRETAYLAERIRDGDLEALVVDSGVLGDHGESRPTSATSAWPRRRA